MNCQQRPRGLYAHILALFGSVLTLSAPTSGQDAASGGPPKPSAPDFSNRLACEILAVRAGNVFVARVDGADTTIRLIGTHVPQDGPAADEARLFAARLLQGESVYLDCDPNWPSRDRDDRLWAYVYRAPDGLFVNLELVRAGCARVSSAASFTHEPLFRAYERIARRAQKGIWSPRAQEAADPPASQPAPQASTRPVTPPDSNADTQVYVTKSGKKYHRKDCQFLTDGSKAMTVKQAQAQGLTPCSRCKPPQ